MCFSATASFTAGAVLLPLGGVALAQAWRGDHRYLVLAAFPVLFGVQQILEGVIWLRHDDPDQAPMHRAALAYLFFAYLLWLVLTPLAAFRVEDRPRLRQGFLAATIFGAAYGLSLFAPLLVDPDWLEIGFARGAIVYDTRLIYDGIVPLSALRLLYAALICGPLLASTAPRVRPFGVLVTLSVVVTFVFAVYAFSSVWCFLAAAMSAYLVVVTHPLAARGDGRVAAA